MSLAVSRNQNFPCCWRSLFGLPSFQSILKFRRDRFCHSHVCAPHSTHLCASSSGFKARLCFGSVRCSTICCFAFCAAVQRALFIEISLDCQTHNCVFLCHSCALSSCALSTCELSIFRSLLRLILWNLLIPKTWPLCRLVFCNTLFHMLGCMCALDMCVLHTPLALELHLLIPQPQLLCFALCSVLLASVL